VKFGDPKNAVSILEFNPKPLRLDLFGVDLQVTGIARADADAILGEELGALFSADGDVNDNACCHLAEIDPFVEERF
jgi:hypothetical protein